MNRAEIEYRIKSLNEYMLSDTDIKLLLLRISSDYTYNKAIAIVPKEHNDNNWYSVDYKNCFRNWNEADAFLDGFCLAKNTNFDRICER